MRGVEVGTTVDLRGLPIGQVTGVRLEYDPTADTIREPVTIEVAPHRIKLDGQRLDMSGQDPVTATNRMFAQLVAKGLRAQLISANLLTGQRAIVAAGGYALGALVLVQILIEQSLGRQRVWGLAPE